MKFPVRTALMLFFCGVVLSAAGCGMLKSQPGEPAQAAGGKVACIAVLPAATGPVAQGAAAEAETKSLRQGAETMDRLLQQELRDQANVRMVGPDLMAGLSLTGGEDSLELARMVSERIGCTAVLETTISRFEERQGSKYSVEHPAAVAFDMRLFAVDSGAVLWSATFDEKQKAVTENLYELKKAKARGFRWITAEGLMLEGIRTKFGDSPYFSGTAGNEPTREETGAK